MNEDRNEWRGCLPLSEAQLSAVERQLQIAFPDALKVLFLRCNGGKPVKSYYESTDIMVELGYLLPIQPPKSTKREPYEVVYNRLRSAGLPSSLVPFGYDTGNAEVFCVDATSGEVVYWVHDEPARQRKHVSDSIADFLSRLEVPPY